jgi:hypothetical protein
MILFRNIQGEVYPNVIDSINYVSRVTGEIQREDYINLNGFVAFTQNLSRAEFTAALEIPLAFGLKNAYNIKPITLEISY